MSTLFEGTGHVLHNGVPIGEEVDYRIWQTSRSGPPFDIDGYIEADTSVLIRIWHLGEVTLVLSGGQVINFFISNPPSDPNDTQVRISLKGAPYTP